MRLETAAGLCLVALTGCAPAAMDPVALKPVMRSNVLAPELLMPRPGSAHVTVVRVLGTQDEKCDAVVQLSFHSVPGGRIVDVAKIWPNDRLDMYPDPGKYRLNVHSMICGLTPVDVDFEVSPGQELAYRVITTPLNVIVEPESVKH